MSIYRVSLYKGKSSDDFEIVLAIPNFKSKNNVCIK